MNDILIITFASLNFGFHFDEFSLVSFDFPNLSEYISVERDSIFLSVYSTNWSY